jgi:type IV pilus assembly protein PilW
MLRKLRRAGSPAMATGFSLVELMVALVVGLIVIGAVLALVVSMMSANNQTIQVTRLTQELRATTAVIASDLKRAKGSDDPFAAAVSGNDYATVDPASGNSNCLRDGYAGASGGGYHAIHLNASKKVVMVAADTFAGAACDADGEQLSSGQVDIDQLSFDVSGRKIEVTITGSLANPGMGVDGVQRTLTQTIFIRSIGS